MTEIASKIMHHRSRFPHTHSLGHNACHPSTKSDEAAASVQGCVGLPRAVAFRATEQDCVPVLVRVSGVARVGETQPGAGRAEAS